MQVTEHRTHARGLADLLLYHALVDDGILLQQDGSLLAAWSYRGPDTMSASDAEMAALSARLNSVLRLGSGWMVQCDAIRSQAPGYPAAGAFPDTVTRIIDDERRQQFTAEGAHYESEYFLTLTYLPPVEAEEKVKGWMFEGHAHRSEPAQLILDRFKSRLEAFENVFGQLFKIERLRLTTEEDGVSTRAQDRLLRYIHRCLTGNDHPIATPEIPVHLNDLLSSEDFCGGIAPRIGGKRIHVIAIDGLPRTSSPGLLRDLDSIPIEYRWNTRALLIDPEEARALLDNTRRKWRSEIRGWKDQVFRTQTGPVNLFAHEMAADAEAAMGIASAGDVQFAQYSSNVVLLDEDAERLRESTRLVMKTIQHLGFACRLETINAIEAWRGSLPGDGYRNVRRTLVHTLNVADLLPTSSVWAGQRENPSSLMPKHSPPLLYAATTGATPFRFNLHVSDLGHTLVCGPSGAGKSTLLGLIAAQWFRYERAQVFAFDKGYSLYVLNKAANGEFYDLAGPKTRLAFCPLRELDTDADVTWAVGWLEALCVLNNLKVTPKHRNALTEAVQYLRLSPSRTLTELSANVQDMDVRDALQHFTLAGPLGSLLDADEDVLGSGRFLTFETENLLQLDDKSVLPVLLYLFRRIEKRLDGSPTLVLLDEAWVYLRHGLFRERMRDWLKTLRRMNGVVVMATQQLSDICNSEIADVVIENCPTKILLPNAESRSPGSREFYQRVGLNERELEILQVSVPKQHYYVVSSLGRRLVDLGIGRVALSWVGVNGREERQLVEKALANMPMPPTGEHVIVRQPAMPYGAPAYGAQLEPPRTPSPAEQDRAAALAREQQAMVAPTSTRQGSASGWTQDAQAAAPGTGSVTAASLAALANSVAGHNSAAPPQNAGKPQSEFEEQNMQAHKESFLSSGRNPQSGDYLPSTRTAPLTQYAIQAGWEIPAVLEQAINSDLPGELKALVMSNVYDTPTGRFLLIPQGSRLIGLYDSHVGYAQDGVQVVWNRIIYPDGSSLDLNGMMGLDSHGNAGLRYDVDHHYKRLVGFAVLTSVFSAAFELSQSRGQSTLQYPSVGQVAGSAVGQEVSQLGEQITRRNLNTQPTIKIPVGYKFNVRVNRDILFDAPYTPLRPAH